MLPTSYCVSLLTCLARGVQEAAEPEDPGVVPGGGRCADDVTFTRRLRVMDPRSRTKKALFRTSKELSQRKKRRKKRREKKRR